MSQTKAAITLTTLSLAILAPQVARATAISSVPMPALTQAVTPQPTQCTSIADAIAMFQGQLLRDGSAGFAGASIDEDTGDQILTLVKIGVRTKLHIRFTDGCWAQEWQTQI